MTEQDFPLPPPDRPDPMSWLDERPRWDGSIDLDRLIRAVPHGIAAAVVDLKSRSTLAARAFAPGLERGIELLAVGAAEYFHSASLTTVEGLDLGFDQAPGAHREAVQKVIIQSRNLLYIFLRAQARPHLILATVCRADANLGLVLMLAREALQELEGGG
jgi:hypothetical protein